MQRVALVGLILTASVSGVGSATPLLAALPAAAGVRDAGPVAAALRETGSYIRRYLHVPLYRVSLEVPDAREVVSRYRKSAGSRMMQPDWDDLAAFLLDPRNHVAVRVSLEMLIDLKGYRAESKCLREALGRMGLAIDARWRLNGPGELQGEVSRFAEAMIGLSADRPGLYYRDRRKGDRYVFNFDGSGGASVTYVPAVDNTTARPGRTEFKDYRVAAALAGALLLPAAGDEGASSAALLGTVRDAWAEDGVTAAAIYPERRS